MADRFYPSQEGVLRNQIIQCFRMGPGEPKECSNKRSISAVVVPHAGYQCSGSCAAYAFKEIAEDGLPDAYVVIGPDHYGVPYEFVMSSEDYWTPFGPCMVDQGIASKLREYIPDDPRAHTREHSIEVELPFLKYIDPKAKIVPIIMGRQSRSSAERLAQAIKMATIGKDVIIIASSDLCHYVPKSYADTADAGFLGFVRNGDVDGMYRDVMSNNLSVCGYGPIATAMLATGMGRTEILKQTDSFEALNFGRDSVVGYGSAVKYKPGF
ncbi:putative dioxygenase [Thermoplasmatales archaeon BRNA1]|nr:putative dioxygenase [Thermoplasmatales archaeon BRNA1]